MAFPGSIPGYAVVQGVDGVPVAVPLGAPGVTVQTQPFYGYPQSGQTTIGGSVPLQAVSNQAHLVAAPPQHTEKAPKPGQYVPLEEQI